VYKVFASKEDLLVEVIEARMRQMYEQAQLLKKDETLSPRDRLFQETLQQFEFFMQFKFNIQEAHELPFHQDGKFAPFVHRLRAGLLNYYKDCLLRAYGQEIDSNIWDLVVTYIGIMKEYAIFTMYANHPLDLEKAAEYIVDRMDDMTAGILSTKPKPVLHPAIMQELVMCGKEGAAVPAAKQKADFFQILFSIIEELSVSSGRKAELNDAAALLQDEIEKDEPKRILIRALLDFLQSQHELNSIAQQLRKLADCAN
jgi:hypothetical protein